MFLQHFQLLIASTSDNCTKSFLGLKAWFGYFPDNWFGPTPNQLSIGKCDLNSNFAFLPSDGHSGLLLIGLAILDDLIRIAALFAVGYVVYGGVLYITSQGSPDSTNRARQTIINALVGVVLAVIASSIVRFVGSRIV